MTHSFMTNQCEIFAEESDKPLSVGDNSSRRRTNLAGPLAPSQYSYDRPFDLSVTSQFTPVGSSMVRRQPTAFVSEFKFDDSHNYYCGRAKYGNAQEKKLCFKGAPPPSAGVLDSSFGTGGEVSLLPDANGATAYNAIQQPDGKILGFGIQNYVDARGLKGVYGLITRYNTDGSLDNSFGTSGRTILPLNFPFRPEDHVTTRIVIRAGAVLPDGKIFVAASATVLSYGSGTTVLNEWGIGTLVARFNADGSPDLSLAGGGFGGQYVLDMMGSATATVINDMHVMPNGKVLLAGSFTDANYQYCSGYEGPVMVAILLDTNGLGDSSFQYNGYPSCYPDQWGVAAMPVFGHHDEATKVVVQDDGKVVLGGWAQKTAVTESDPNPDVQFAVVRLLPNGQPDSHFGRNGRQVTSFLRQSFGQAVALQQDQKIVIAGYTQDAPDASKVLAVARLTTTGALDVGFGTGGGVTTVYNCATELTAKTIIPNPDLITILGVAANGSRHSFALTQFTQTGTLARTFARHNGKEVIVAPGDQTVIMGASLQGDGKIIAAVDDKLAQEKRFNLVRIIP
jgi:uncharacterized delta-60 repeat protein